MKTFKTFSIAVISAFFVMSSSTFGQQWQGSQDTTGNVYRNGNVGIGTTSPKNKFEVHGNIALPYRSALKTINMKHNKILTTGYNDTNYFDFVNLYVPGNDSKPAREPIMTLTHNGNVGIGTATPGATLDVLGDGITDFRVGENEGINLHLKNFNSQLSDVRGSTFGMQIIGPLNSHIVMDVQGNDSGDGFYLRVPSDYNNPKIVDHTAFTVQSNGRVGIGTPAPEATLDVLNGDITNFRIGSNGAMNLHMRNFTTQLKDVPGSRFGMQIIGPMSSHIVMDLQGNDSADGFYVRVPSDYNNPSNVDHTAFAVQSSGRVGIGTPTPEATLDVLNGDITNFRIGSNGAMNLHMRNFTTQLSDVPGSTFGMQIIGPMSSHIVMDIQGNDSGDGFYIRVPSDYNNPNIVDQTAFAVQSNGRVGIGTTSPQQELDVDGTIRSKEIIVESNGADFVFEPGYELPTLVSVEEHIVQKRHLPGIPSAAEMQKNGMGVSQMQTKLLQKIEELTLYVIDLKKENTMLMNRLNNLEKKSR